ncbi:MAG: pyruvate dehydrogenase complex dihydrolipoamide acetyltransferase [Actinomycetales bacterium]|nr:pyruvate dehydrogenase complex dihydrolipoamide acetyltransferase [Actinomycetales bacterium]
MASIIRLPEVMANATEAVIATWVAAEGTEVSVGDVLAEIETERAVVEMNAEEAGVLAKHLVPAGTLVQVGAPVALLLASADEPYDLAALLGEEGAAEPEPEVGAQGPTTAPSGTVSSSTDPEPGSASSDTSHGGSRVFASPLARKLAREAGVSVDVLTGSGPGGRIVRRDVERHLAETPAGAATPSHGAPSSADAAAPSRPSPSALLAAAGETLVPHSPMRRAIARRLTESKQTVPHFYLVAETRVDALLALRAQANADPARRKLSVNDFVLKAVAAAFRAVPEANVAWSEEGMRRFEGIDVAVAVATEGGGLLTPVVRGVDRLTVTEVSAAVADLAGRAREGRLRQDELEGGSTTVSNLGMFGTREFSAIINPPQATILAVGAAIDSPVVVDGRLEVAKVMRCTLSADHRAIDGALAARWLAAFTEAIENPVVALL